MESRNIKTIDEHGIDRDAKIICGLKIDNYDYVLYAIERDGENDNLFVSKIVKNLDGTSNMVNIEESMEKEKINTIVKELVTYAINNEADKTTGVVKLANGSEVSIYSILFNKEQNINVTKTYITTVKKTVTKVSENFFSVPSEENLNTSEASFFDTVKDDIFATPTPAEPVAKQVVPEPATVVPDSVVPTSVESVSPILPEVNLSTSNVQQLGETVNVVPPVSEPVEVVPPVSVSTPLESVLPANNDVKSDVQSVPVTPIFDTAPTAVDSSSTAIPSDNNLVFDGSKETNLNEALNDSPAAAALPVSDVNALREFGQNDVPVVSDSSNAVANTPVQASNPSGGFANKKFFMVIAILLFVAACVFLGYEAFKYFQLTK